jgi:hypothetical protein
VGLGGIKELHAAFLTESRTREHGWCRVQEIRVAPSFHPTYARVNAGHPPLLSPLRWWRSEHPNKWPHS